ncbi:hypothetical protein [[Eubacterium] cellulosolvens]
MKNNSSGRSFFVSRAVEEPLEATFELGEEIKKISGQLTRPVLIGICGLIVLFILLIPSFYLLIKLFIDGFMGNLEISNTELIYVSFLGLITILLLAIIITTLVYLIQIHKFNNHLLQRYSMVVELKDMTPEALSNSETKPKIKKGGSKQKKFDQKGKHVRNPIYAMLDLVEESMHQIPQLLRLIRICKYFISIIIIYLIVTLFIKLIFNQNLLFSVGNWELGFGAIAFILSIPILKSLMDTEKVFLYIQARHNIIDGVRFEKDISVPPGKDKISRLMSYLTKNDPYIKTFAIDNLKALKNISITGRSGNEHKFDIYFSLNNELPRLSSRLGMAKGRLSVFIKVFKKPITLKALLSLRDAVVDVCEKENSMPLRVIAFQQRIEELEDEVYDYVLENPIILRKFLSHIQIVAEDGDVYSFIPFVSYGDEGLEEVG